MELFLYSIFYVKLAAWRFSLLRERCLTLVSMFLSSLNFSKHFIKALSAASCSASCVFWDVSTSPTWRIGTAFASSETPGLRIIDVSSSLNVLARSGVAHAPEGCNMASNYFSACLSNKVHAWSSIIFKFIALR